VRTTNNDERRTTNDGRRTTNDERRTTNNDDDDDDVNAKVLKRRSAGEAHARGDANASSVVEDNNNVAAANEHCLTLRGKGLTDVDGCLWMD